MAIVLANASKPGLLDGVHTESAAWKLRLFVNNYTPVGDSDTADFTECTDTGYSEVDPDFASPTLNDDDQGELLGPAKTWVFTYSGGTFTIYGYFVVDGSDNLIYAERAASPVTITATGQLYTVVPRLVLDTLT